MKKTKIYGWFQPVETAKNMGLLAFLIAFMIAFIDYKVWKAITVLAICSIGLIMYQIRFVVVSGYSIMQFRWFHIDCEIPLDELEHIYTKRDVDLISMCFFGKEEVLTVPYRKKTFRQILLYMGIPEEECDRFMQEKGEEYSVVCNGYRLKRKNIPLDFLFDKKVFVKREVDLEDEEDEQ